MQYSKTIFAFLFLLATITSKVVAQSSVLSSGSWYKVAVDKHGVYKITFDQFKKMGFDVANVDPRKIKIYGNEGGMLPQANSSTRSNDLVENAIFINGENDGAFNSGDYLLFFAQGPEVRRYDVGRKIFQYESNLYSKKNFYFITVAADQGKRIAPTDNPGSGFPVIQKFDDVIYHEVDEYTELKSGREWFGERFDLTTEHVFGHDLPGIIEGSEIKFVSDVMAQSFNGSSFKLFFNATPVGEQVVPGISNTQYGVKGRHNRDTITLNASAVLAPGRSNQEIKYQYTKTSGQGTGYLDFYLLSFQRKLALYGNQTIFLSEESLTNQHSTFEVNGITNNCLIWDISTPYEPKLQPFTLQGDKASFSSATSELKTFIVFNTSVPSPELVGKIPTQNLHGLSTPNLIMVTHPNFLAEAQQLALHRQNHSNWTTAVVTPEEIFNEFSSGRQDVTAIRDFTKYLYDKNPSVLKALLLFGKGSYDYKDRVTNNTNFVPTYESRSSLTPLETYSSDDYFGFLEMGEGNWGESVPVQNHTLDIGIGRLPVKTTEEAQGIVDKIISYDKNKKALGRWRKKIVFVADDGSTSDNFTSVHQDQANTMADLIEATTPEFDTKKNFLGTYSKTVRPSGETIPEANKAIMEDFNRGALIINYTGHGSERLWADEKVFTDLDIQELNNERYPFLVTATCEFGRNDDPAQISSAELSVLRHAGGCIGLVTTARPVYSFTNFELNQAFYEALFQKESNRYLTLGEIFRRTKNNSTSGVGNRNFSMLADPSLTLAMPSLLVHVSEVKTVTGSDTLKALSTVIVTGEIRDSDNTLMENFNGTLEATLFDKQTDFATIGKNNPPYKFKQWHNVLFRGMASVEDGTFAFTFTLPKNIAYQIAPGKLSLYASDPQQEIDAAGSSSTFKIGGSEPNPAADNTAPAIQLFMGDTTFVNGGIVSPNTTLLVKLKDASGINISNYGIGNTLIAVLDNDAQVYVLNDYYESVEDDFTNGWITFPLQTLSPGKHTITVKAWDTYNNPAQATIEFIVTDGEALVIETFANFPNPFQDETTIYFTHNRSGDDLQGELHIYEMTGRELQSFEFTVPSSPYQVTLMEWSNLEKKLPGGLYLARVAVRSLTNGSKNEQLTKLIITN